MTAGGRLPAGRACGLVTAVRMRANAGIFFAWLSGQVACGDPRTPAERAEPPAEPPLTAEGFAEAPGELRIDGEVRFAGGATIGARTLAPAEVRAGGRVKVEFAVTGASGRLRVGLQAPRAAGRQEARGQQSLPKEHVVDLRDAWIEEVRGEAVELEFAVPRPWHASHVVIVAELVGDVAVAGPRRADGRAILGAVPVTPEPTQVAAPRADAIEVDGRLDEPVWAAQSGTPLTDSLDGEPDPSQTEVAGPGLGALEPRFGTRVAFAWDEHYLYAAADLPDPDLWSDYTQQDDPLYKQEAFELFVAAGGEARDYLEYQVSARGVTFDARFPRHRAGDEGWDSRGRTAVQAVGTVNDARDRDRGLLVEVAIPWDELCEQAKLACPPRPGMQLRVNAFRLEREGRKRPIGLSLSPTRVPDFHAWDNAAVLVLQ